MTQLVLIIGSGKVSDGVYHLLGRSKALSWNGVAYRGQWRHCKEALGWVDNMYEVAEALEEWPLVCEMFFQLAGKEDVFETHKTIFNTISDLIHKTLEGLSSVPQSKEHPGELKRVERCCDSSIRDALLSSGFLVVGPQQVSAGEYTAACQILRKRNGCEKVCSQ